MKSWYISKKTELLIAFCFGPLFLPAIHAEGRALMPALAIEGDEQASGTTWVQYDPCTAKCMTNFYSCQADFNESEKSTGRMCRSQCRSPCSGERGCTRDELAACNLQCARLSDNNLRVLENWCAQTWLQKCQDRCTGR